MWIFDLDNTLHDARVRIFPAMHDQINAFLQRRFSLDEAGAGKMREHFWRTYGTPKCETHILSLNVSRSAASSLRESLSRLDFERDWVGA